MKKTIFASAVVLMAVGAMNALPVNRALSFATDGTVECGAMPQLNNLDSYSIQFWLNPDNWTENAVLMKRGDNFSVKLGSANNIIVNNGDKSLTVNSSDLVPGNWNQVTLICDNGNAKVLVNGTEVASGTLGSLDETKRGFIMGGGYEGMLDEVRLWNAALNDEMKTFDYFTNNTLNKWCPMWENLVAYYKMDQENCPEVVEYKAIITPKADSTNNHGKISKGVSRVDANNEKMPYLVSSAYTENARFYDRLIPQDAYLLSNEIIILGADCVAADGSLKFKTPNNHATLHGGITPVEKLGVRNGVIKLDGKEGTYLEAPALSTHKYKVDNLSTTAYSNTDLTEYTIITRVYLNEWQPGACLFSKENADHTQGLALLLGEAENTLTVRINGISMTSNPTEKFGLEKWNHVALVPNPSGLSSASKFLLYVGGNGVNFVKPDQNISNLSLAAVENQPIRIGEGLNGYIDEAYFSNFSFGSGMIETYCNKDVPVPSVERGQAVARMNAIGYLYNFDDPEDLGYSSISQDNILKQIKKQYEGYTQPRIILSVRGHDNNTYEDAFRVIMNDENLRENFAKEVAAASENYDGIEFDMEWIAENNSAGHTNFQNLPNAVSKYLPEGKIFRISIHNEYYSFAKGQVGNEKVTGFTVQQYGPNVNPYYYTTFTNSLTNLSNVGYPKSKLMTSFSTTMTSGGVKDGALDEANFTSSDANYASYKDATFMTPIQVFRRAKYTRDNGYMGIFYWDMGNDYWLGEHQSDGTNKYDGMPKYNQTKYANYALSANIDPVVTSVELNHPETDAELVEDDNPTAITTIFGELPENVDVYGLSGVVVTKGVSKHNLMNSLSKGEIYIINGVKVLIK